MAANASLIGSQQEMPRSVWSQMALLLGDRRRAIASLAATSILSGFTEAGILAIVAEVATGLVNGAHRITVSLGPGHVDATIGDLLVFASILALVRLLIQWPLSRLPARIAADVQAELRRQLFAAFTNASWSAQSRDREGHLQEMMTNQVGQATFGTLQAGTLISAVFTFMVLILSAFALNVAAAIVVMATATLLFAALRPVSALGHRRAQMLSSAHMKYAGGVGEAVRVAEETHVFGVAVAQRARIDELISESRALFFRTQFIARLAPALYQSSLFIIIVGGLSALYTLGNDHIASLGAVVLLLVRAGTYGQQFQGAYQAARQALPFAERLQDAKQRYIASRPVAGDRPLLKIDSLACRDVSYEYKPGRPVLTGVNFDVSNGEVIGIVGPSGAGKSTLIQILLQLRMPVSGRYLINGQPAQAFDPSDWHNRVAYVPQEPRLLHATVADNIRYFRDLDDEAVERAASLARIHDDIVEWTHAYDTVIGPRADAVSGGQQQRICLARALVAQPEVLVLDEPTSALDPNSEWLLQESLRSLVGRTTMFIAAHRMSTLDMCGRVMVIVDGKMDAFETIDILHRENAYYRSAVELAPRARTGGLP
jgi:ATP-binding cassette, subfamily B, bacterial